MPRIRIGISGWRYPNWRGAFYPRGLPQKAELAYAAARFGSVEINGSFYSLQRPEDYRAWRSAAPRGFVFAVKGGRFITHMKKLRDVETALANFFASGVLALGDALGPILWQLPPQLPFDPARLAGFFDLLPRDTAAAARLARRHDARLAGRADLRARGRHRIRHALEVRHPSYATPAYVSLLRRYRIGHVVADTAGRWPLFEDVTAGFVYVRLHGAEELYASGYDDAALDRWARRIAAWARGVEPEGARRAAPEAPAPRRSGRDVYVYFDNDAKAHAPFDAAALAARLSVGPRAPLDPRATGPVARSAIVAGVRDPRWELREP